MNKQELKIAQKVIQQLIDSDRYMKDAEQAMDWTIGNIMDELKRLDSNDQERIKKECK